MARGDAVSGVVPPWDGPYPASRGVPEWADKLRRSCTRYVFTTMQVHEGRSVMARKVSGTGPMLVITDSEDEMRAALGLMPREPQP